MSRHPSPSPASRRQFLARSGATLTAALLGAAGCSAPGGGADSTQAAGASAGGARTLTEIGLDYPFTQIPLYSSLVALTSAAAKKRGVSLVTTSDGGSADTQAANLRTWVSRKTQAIVSFPMVFEATEAIAEAALDAGLIWVTYGGTLEHQSADIQFDFLRGGTLLGEAAARWANERLDGKGKIAFLTDDTIQLGRERTKGMIDAFTRAAPGVDVVAREQAIDPDSGLSRSRAVLAKHPDLNIILGVTDAAAYGGFKALQQTGRDSADARTFVGGQDGAVPSLLAIKKGTFYRASAALAPRDIAGAVVDVPLAVAAGKADPSVQVPVTLVGHGDTARIDALLAQNS
ncbi:sugar ABC transporter substrate-binding protein [Streptomyces sp. NPDC001500]